MGVKQLVGAPFSNVSEVLNCSCVTVAMDTMNEAMGWMGWDA